MDKTTLRKQMLSRRKDLSKDDVAERSKFLVEMLLDKVDLSKIKKLHCFLPIIASNEPDMRQFIKHAGELGIEVFTSNPTLPVGEVDVVVNNYYLGDATQFDLVIVPMLAYDPITKHRLGFGGGFYDRLLASQPEANTIGVCFKDFAIDSLPTEPHDQPLQKVFAV